ncbi:MAG: hypothetical protein GXO23_06955 [Crenarchaeota archaeon]|nr:hypothetical protein [Thermoproteota archaeon]
MLYLLTLLLIFSLSTIIAVWLLRLRRVVKIIAPILSSVPFTLFMYCYPNYIVLIATVLIILLSCAISLEVIEERLLYAQSLIYVSLAYLTVFLFLVSSYVALASLWLLASTFFAPLLARSRKRESLYSCVKYVTFSAIGSTLLMIGITMFIVAPALRAVSLVLILLGVLYEIGVVPLHMWMPDVYKKSDRESVAFLSSLMKIVAVIVFVRLLASLGIDSSFSTFSIISILSVITMIVGNLGALFANDVERILAFSSIAQAGYGIAVLSVCFLDRSLVDLCLGALALQILSVSISKCALFLGLDSDGRGVRSMVLINALSLIGIPPLIGFWPKLFIVWYAIQGGQIWLAIAVVVNSAISVPYYIRLLRVYQASKASRALTVLMILLTVLVIVLGLLFPLEIFRECVNILHVFNQPSSSVISLYRGPDLSSLFQSTH